MKVNCIHAAALKKGGTKQTKQTNKQEDSGILEPTRSELSKAERWAGKRSESPPPHTRDAFPLRFSRSTCSEKEVRGNETGSSEFVWNCTRVDEMRQRTARRNRF